MIKRDMYVVKWQDIASTADWREDTDDDVSPVECVTIGWYLEKHVCEKKGTYIRMAHTKNDYDRSCIGQVAIPVGCITFIKRVDSMDLVDPEPEKKTGRQGRRVSKAARSR